MKLMPKEMNEYIANNECTSKEAILKRLQKKIDKYVERYKSDAIYPQSYYALITLVLHALYEKIQAAVLFDVLPECWVYDLDLNYDEFSLNMEHIHHVEVDDDGEFRSYQTDGVYKMISIHPKSFTVEEYAKFYEVEQGTVRQWIRRGKLRTAYKAGNEWMIPELTPPPSRGYEAAQYKWFGGVDNLPEEYAYLADYVLATFMQDREDKSKYRVLLVSKEAFRETGAGKNTELLLDAKERERLELFMIGHPRIKYCGHMI